MCRHTTLHKCGSYSSRTDTHCRPPRSCLLGAHYRAPRNKNLLRCWWRNTELRCTFSPFSKQHSTDKRPERWKVCSLLLTSSSSSASGLSTASVLNISHKLLKILKIVVLFCKCIFDHFTAFYCISWDQSPVNVNLCEVAAVWKCLPHSNLGVLVVTLHYRNAKNSKFQITH